MWFALGSDDRARRRDQSRQLLDHSQVLELGRGLGSSLNLPIPRLLANLTKILTGLSTLYEVRLHPFANIADRCEADINTLARAIELGHRSFCSTKVSATFIKLQFFNSYILSYTTQNPLSTYVTNVRGG